jgi:hypothetical protein
VSILHDLEDDAGYLRAGIYGFGGAGKTRTAVELAIGVRDYFHLEDPIGFFDTESGVGYVSSLIKSRTGRPRSASASARSSSSTRPPTSGARWSTATCAT